LILLKIRFIGIFAFSDCKNITSVSIGDSIRTIGESAFLGSGIEKIIIGSSIEYIGGVAFYSSSLQEIIIKSISPPFILNSAFTSSTKKKYSGLRAVQQQGIV
jgi:hypothetical protein